MSRPSGPLLESFAVILVETDGGNKDGNRIDCPTGLSVGSLPPGLDTHNTGWGQLTGRKRDQ